VLSNYLFVNSCRLSLQSAQSGLPYWILCRSHGYDAVLWLKAESR
jgi:hypothetical protein